MARAMGESERPGRGKEGNKRIQLGEGVACFREAVGLSGQTEGAASVLGRLALDAALVDDREGVCRERDGKAARVCQPTDGSKARAAPDRGGRAQD